MYHKYSRPMIELAYALNIGFVFIGYIIFGGILVRVVSCSVTICVF